MTLTEYLNQPEAPEGASFEERLKSIKRTALVSVKVEPGEVSIWGFHRGGRGDYRASASILHPDLGGEYEIRVKRPTDDHGFFYVYRDDRAELTVFACTPALVEAVRAGK